MHASNQLLNPWNDLYDKLTKEIDNNDTSFNDIIGRTSNSIKICQIFIDKVNECIEFAEFESDENEILFFKDVRPRFYSHLYYYQHLYEVEVARPAGGAFMQVQYLEKKLSELQYLFYDYKYIYCYWKGGQSYLDEKLFLRSNYLFNPFNTKFEWGLGSHLGTGNIIAKMIANERIEHYIEKEIRRLKERCSGQGTTSKNERTLTWTDSKAALIELSYAFQSAGTFNNGNVDVKQIVEFFEGVFEIDLGNSSRTFQEILCRKSGYCTFIDRLKSKLLDRIDQLECH